MANFLIDVYTFLRNYAVNILFSPQICGLLALIYRIKFAYLITTVAIIDFLT